MKKTIIGFLAVFTYAGIANSACDTNVLEKCIDSVCAVGISLDSGVRCKLCGTSVANVKSDTSSSIYSSTTPTFKSLSLGNNTSTSNMTLNPDEAPSAPSDKYAYAINECISKVSDCDVSDIKTRYDNLISDSCKSAAGQASITSMSKKTNKSDSDCYKLVKSCMSESNKCGSGFNLCAETLDGTMYNKNLSVCMTSVSGCGGASTYINKTMKSDYETAQKEIKSVRDNYAKNLKSEREKKIANFEDTCKTGFARCQVKICENSSSSCADTKDKNMAKKMCEYINLACQEVKR